MAEFNPKIIRNVPEEERIAKEEELKAECDALYRETVQKTEEFLEEFNRYQTIACPVCDMAIEIDTHSLEEKVLMTKEGIFFDKTVYATTIECPECKSVISLSDRTKREMNDDISYIAKGLATVLVLFGVTIGLILMTIKFDEDAMNTDVLLSPPQTEIFEATVVDVNADAYTFEDEQGDQLVVITTKEHYKVGDVIEIKAVYYANGEKTFCDNDNPNAWSRIIEEES